MAFDAIPILLRSFIKNTYMKEQNNHLQADSMSAIPFDTRNSAFEIPSPLSSAWPSFLQGTSAFAEQQIRRLKWRGLDNGVLPEGYDANSVAAQAMLEFLVASSSPSNEAQTIIQSPPGRSSRSDEAHTQTQTLTSSALEELQDDIQYKLNRLVLRNVTRLHHLKENWLLSSEADLLPVQDMDDQSVSPLELIPAPDVKPDDALLHKESLIRFYHLKHGFTAYLGRERRLIKLFHLGCDGIIKPETLSSRLRVGVRDIENLRKRLRRKATAFFGTQMFHRRTPCGGRLPR